MGYTGEIAYFFEAGHDSQGEAGSLLSLALRHAQQKKLMRYGGHAFVEKEKAPQAQAADLLAWSLTKDIRSSREGRKRRKDFESLAQHPHGVAHITADVLEKMEPFWAEQRERAMKLLGDPGPVLPRNGG